MMTSAAPGKGQHVTLLAFLSDRLGQKTISEKLFKIDERLNLLLPLDVAHHSDLISPIIPG
jgi:hypothetical protein